MKMTVSKIDAARAQLLEAIRLFFEKRDPISIHTLVGAAMQIVHDHIDEGTALDENLFFHYDTIYIKDEYRKKFKDKINEATNFFKHADRDLREGKVTIEFETASTDFRIVKSIRCLKIIEGDAFVNSPEFRVYIVWYALKYPTHIKGEARQKFAKINRNPERYDEFREVISLMTKNPDLIEEMGKTV